MYLLGDSPEQPMLFPPVWPAPSAMQVGGERVELTAAFALQPDPACAGSHGNILGAAVARYEGILRPSAQQERHSAVSLPSVSICVRTADEALGPDTAEGYELHVPADGSPGIINATTVFGALHALKSTSHWRRRRRSWQRRCARFCGPTIPTERRMELQKMLLS